MRDLSKAGIPAKTADKIASMVTVSGTPAVAHTARRTPSFPEPAPSSVPGTTAPQTRGERQQAPSPPSAGMVWVNTDSKIFHREGSRWYGKTQAGQYMTEAEALKEGNREAK